MGPSKKFDPKKLKVCLTISLQRLKNCQIKKANQQQITRKEIAKLLSLKKDNSAYFKTETIICEDRLLEVLELTELFCQLLLARFGLIEHMKYCDDSILEAVCSIIWISPRLITEAKELEQVRNWLLVKYGEEFCKNAMGNKGDCVNEKLLKRTEVRPPSKKLVLAYMKEIAYAANVDWAPPKTPSETKTESLTEESCPSSLPSQEFDQEESLDLPALDDLPPPGSSSEFSDLPRDALKNIKSNLNLSSDSASDSPDDFSNLINRFNNLK